mmetsp:Transcript_39897/g.58620  ORF Transcript_39897/g.58620 Transcript_39897/m.58620 type:complete len:87 (+) Transcript_39897:507-767(+)
MCHSQYAESCSTDTPARASPVPDTVHTSTFTVGADILLSISKSLGTDGPSPPLFEFDTNSVSVEDEDDLRQQQQLPIMTTTTTNYR